MWTQFWDMHSGGGSKEPQDKIYIQAPEDEAKIIFYNLLGHNPERVSCTCCGEDYSISECESLQEATAYHRNCAYENGGYVERPNREYGNNRPLTKLEDYVKQDDVLVIYATDITPNDRIGEVPRQGYIWQD